MQLNTSISLGNMTLPRAHTAANASTFPSYNFSSIDFFPPGADHFVRTTASQDFALYELVSSILIDLNEFRRAFANMFDTFERSARAFASKISFEDTYPIFKTAPSQISSYVERTVFGLCCSKPEFDFVFNVHTRNGVLTILQRLYEEDGVDAVSIVDTQGNTYAHDATLEVVEWLYSIEELRPLLSAQNNEGDTPLHLVALAIYNDTPQADRTPKKLIEKLRASNIYQFYKNKNIKVKNDRDETPAQMLGRMAKESPQAQGASDDGTVLFYESSQ